MRERLYLLDFIDKFIHAGIYSGYVGWGIKDKYFLKSL